MTTHSLLDRLAGGLRHASIAAGILQPDGTARDPEGLRRGDEADAIRAVLAEFDAHETRNLWIMEAPVILISHITEATNELFELSDDETLDHWCIHHINGGWLIFVGEDEGRIPKELPEELKALMLWCVARKFIWLRLDQDGDELPGYPVHDW